MRVKEVDFAQHILFVRDGKGAKDRIIMLPETMLAPLQEHLRWCVSVFKTSTVIVCYRYPGEMQHVNTYRRPTKGPELS